MVNAAIWWFGALHAAAYAIVGCFIVLTLGVVRAHMFANVMGRIITWHIARARWNRRHIDGLKDSEWQRGEPKP
jgi:hypothetical protein